MSRLQGKLTYSNVVATICLFVVLGGGAWAASTGAFHSVGHKQLRPNAVDSRRVDNGTLRQVDLAKALRPPTGGVDIPWYFATTKQPVITIPGDTTEIASTKVPAGRYFISVNMELFATDDTPPDNLKPVVNCMSPGGQASQSLPYEHGYQVLSYSSVSFIGNDDKVDLRCDAHSTVDVQTANVLVYAIRLGDH